MKTILFTVAALLPLVMAASVARDAGSRDGEAASADSPLEAAGRSQGPDGLTASSEGTRPPRTARADASRQDPGHSHDHGSQPPPPEGTTPPQTAPSKGHGHHGDETDDATATHAFNGIDRWVAVFDDPERDAWQKPDELVKALGLKPGMNVADIGAGTGYFNRRLAEAVGPSGKVYAVDVEPEMIAHMNQRAVKEKTPNVAAVLADPDDPKLPAAGIDRILICDTYHHINDRLAYFDKLKKTLRPGGRLAIVDFQKKELPVGPPPEHKLDRDHVAGEMAKAGWRLVEEPTFLPYQYFLIYEPK